MKRTLPVAVAVLLLGLMAGCDSNPDGPSFPAIPDGPKPPPANLVPKAIPGNSSEKPIDNTLPG
jgi:hypothetical protein